MLETLKLSRTLKSSRDDFNVLDNFNVSSIKTANPWNCHLKFLNDLIFMIGCFKDCRKHGDAPTREQFRYLLKPDTFFVCTVIC